MEAAAVSRTPRRGFAAAGSAHLLRLAGDARLARAAGAGSDAAFEVLYERHHRPLLAFCRHVLGTREEAEDAVQSTFMAAYHELRSDPDRSIEFRPWLYTIARHRCQRTLRARKPRELDGRPVTTEGLGEQVQRRADLRAILGDLAELPEDQRVALLLAQLHGMSHEEIATVLSVPTKKVKALVFQARASLVASREARAIPCADIRVQLAELSGGALRRRSLQRHLRSCEGCREFRTQLRRQRSLLAAALPVIPSAGLRETVLGTTTGGAASAGGGGLLATAAALKGVAAKLAAGAGATAALAGGMVAGGTVLRSHHAPAPPAANAESLPDRDGHSGPTVAVAARTPAAAAAPSAARRPARRERPTAPARRHQRRAVAVAGAPAAQAPAPSTRTAAGAPSGTQAPTTGGDAGSAPQPSASAPAGGSSSQGQGDSTGKANGNGNGQGNGNAYGQDNGSGNAGSENASSTASSATTSGDTADEAAVSSASGTSDTASPQKADNGNGNGGIPPGQAKKAQ
jgi:RNA polymerase sigma factor (sigma-70 family)